MKKYIIKLKNWLEFSHFEGNYHFIVILLILLFIFYKTYSLFIMFLFVILIIFIFIKHKPLFILSLILTLFISIIFFGKTLLYKISKKDINSNLIVVDVEEKDNYQKVTFKSLFYKYIYYNKDTTYFKVGQIYKVVGSIVSATKERTPNGFDSQDYQKNLFIVGTLEINKIEYRNTLFIPSSLNYYISKYYDSHFDYSDILKALVIGTKSDLDSDLKENISKVGISHLFVVSGLHVGIIVKILEKILSLIRVKESKRKFIILPFLFIYYVITKFLVSVLRVTFSYLLKDLKYNLTSLDKMSLNIIIVLIINPLYIYTYSFILTYLISSMIIIVGPLLSKKKGILIYILNTIIISLLSVVITIPIVINISSDINILSILYNVFYIPFVSYIVLPLSIIVTFLPFLEKLINVIFNFFIFSINKLSNISLLTFSLPKISIEMCIIYYLLLIFLIFTIEKKKYYYLIFYFLFLFGWHNIKYLDYQDKIVFLDVAEGDATHISSSFNRCNIIIDTGVSTDDTIISYLKKEGVKIIDLIIISHGDDDHNGNLEKLLNNFKVKKVIISSYDNKTLEILKRCNYLNFIQVKFNDNIKIKKINIDFLWPYKDTNDVNNNSLVFTLRFFNMSILFTGDIEEKAEIELIKKVKVIDVNILKIAHHASNTSTKKDFLENIKFDIAVAMTGSKNTYGFPNHNTVNRLKNYNVYYTSESYTITFYKKFFEKKFKIKYLNS